MRRGARALVERVRRYLRGHERRFVALGLVAVVAGLLEAAVLVTVVPLVQAIAAEDGSLDLDVVGFLADRAPTVGQLLVIGLLLVAGRLVVQLELARRRARLNADWDAELRKRVFEAYMDADWELQAEQHSSHIQELLTAHVGNSQAILAALSNGWIASFNLFVLVVAALVINPIGAVAITAFGVAMFVGMRPFSNRAESVSTELSGRNLDYVQAISDASHLTREIRTFGVGGEVKAEFGDQVGIIRRLRQRAMFLGGAVSALYQNLVIAVVLLALGLIYLVAPSQLPSLAVVVLILIRAMTYSQTLHTAYHHVRESGPFLERLEETEDEYRARPAPTGGADVDAVRAMTFESVTYRYPTARSTRPALDQVSFTAARGRMIGVVGPSGSGKSTLVQLLLGLRAPTEGRILVNDRDASSLSLSARLDRVSFVPQEPALLTASVADNIVFHRVGVTADQVVEAARRAHLHDDVTEWPAGYDTLVGDGGRALSGGQRQRICIARALIGDPDVIIFDEPTSALDVFSESAIQASLEDLRAEKLVFIVAHRMSTLETCDEIMVLLDGHLQDLGPSALVRRRNPWFAEALELSQLVDRVAAEPLAPLEGMGPV